MVRVFANGPGDLGSIPAPVIPKTQKMVLDASLLNIRIIRQASRVKWSNPGEGIACFLTPWCSSYRKGSLWVTLDYGRQLYYLALRTFFHNFICTSHRIYIYVCVCVLLDTSLINTRHYKVVIKGKVERSRERSRALSTPQCSSYWKGSLCVTLDCSRQLYFLLRYIL